MSNWIIHNEEILAWCREYDGPKFHAMLCDPPYELGFMGKDWDKSGIAFNSETWEAFKEHLLPGAFIFVFGSSRGWHRLAVAIEDAGFVFHPSIMMWGWVQGQGFCKATRIDTQIDRAAGKLEEREVVGRYVSPEGTTGLNSRTGGGLPGSSGQYEGTTPITAPATDLARAWEGHRYGRQALKPAVEMIICAQRPYEGKPFECITETGAGALFIDGGRVGTGDNLGRPLSQKSKLSPIALQASPSGAGSINEDWKKGRWPPNFCLVHTPNCRLVGTKRVKGHTGYPNGPGGNTFSVGQPPDGSRQEAWPGYADEGGLETVDEWSCVEECAARRIGEQSGERRSAGLVNPTSGITKEASAWSLRQTFAETGVNAYNDTGTAARFFPQFDWNAEVTERLMNNDQVKYCAKAGRGERTAGTDGNAHPTVKPIALAKWLATLLLPPPEYAPRRILIPFAGVMSEAIGAMLAGWEEIVGVEMEEEYCEIGEARMKFWSQFGSHEEAMKAAGQIRQGLKKQKGEDEGGRLRLW